MTANHCTDDTASRARQAGAKVRDRAVAPAGKTYARIDTRASPRRRLRGVRVVEEGHRVAFAGDARVITHLRGSLSAAMLGLLPIGPFGLYGMLVAFKGRAVGIGLAPVAWAPVCIAWRSFALVLSWIRK